MERIDEHVVLDGLSAKPELNGKHGIVKTWDAERGRYGVRLKHNGALVSVRPANIVAANVINRREIQKILDDPDSTQAARDFARMRLAEEEPLPPDHGVSTVLHHGDAAKKREHAMAAARDNPELARWGYVELFERNGEGDPWDVVGDAAAAYLEDESKLAMRAVMRDGRPNRLAAYPRLAAACKCIIETPEVVHDAVPDDLIAAAHVVLYMLKDDPTSKLGHIDKAIRLRPENPRQHYHRSALYACSQNWANAAEDIRTSIRCATTELERWSYQGLLGKCFNSMHRNAEARKTLETYVATGFGSLQDQLDDRKKGHCCVAQYMLVHLCDEAGDVSAAKQHFREAEAREKALDPFAHKEIDWGNKMLAQLIIAKVSSSVGANRECYHCHTPALKLLTCTGCQAAHYCSKDCQKAAWKGGHKKECGASAKAKGKAAKEDSKEERMAKKKLTEEALSRPPLDSTLEPREVWAEACKLSAAKQCEEAAFKFVMAIFLDQSLDANDRKPVLAALEGCAADSVVAAVLRNRLGKGDPYSIGELDREHDSLTRRFLDGTRVDKQPAATIEDLDRTAFALACSGIFYARLINKTIDPAQALRASKDPKIKGKLLTVQRLIADSAELLVKEQWLTLLFELGYSHQSVGAVDDAKRWLEMFKSRLPRSPNAHWKSFAATADQYIMMQPMIKMMWEGKLPGM